MSPDVALKVEVKEVATVDRATERERGWVRREDLIGS